jgi:hypothetical protein
MPRASSQAEFAAALFALLAPVPAGITTRRGEPDPARFNVYRNNVMVSLIGALEQRFPVTRKLAGDDFFRMMARAYIATSKPRSPPIWQYGEDFPAFAAGFEAAREVAYLGDVAALEALWSRAYHAADAEPMPVAALASVEPELLPSAGFVPHPSAGLFCSRWPAGSIWEAHQHDPVASLTHAGPETVLVVRPGSEVKVHLLPAHDRDFAAALFAGRPAGEAASAAADERFDFGRAIVGLVSLGAFQTIEFDRERSNP